MDFTIAHNHTNYEHVSANLVSIIIYIYRSDNPLRMTEHDRAHTIAHNFGDLPQEQAARKLWKMAILGD